MLSQFKLYALIAALAVWTGGVWYVTSSLKEAGYNAERLAQAQEIIKIKDENAALATKLSKDVLAALAEYKKGQNAIKPTAPVYNDCLVDDSVRDQYKRKLEAQRRLAK